jgi:hypothetical protein
LLNDIFVGISNFFTISWPIGEEAGTIKAYEIPNYGTPKNFSLLEIKKFSKNKELNKPNPTISGVTTSEKLWSINVPSKIGKYFLKNILIY